MFFLISFLDITLDLDISNTIAEAKAEGHTVEVRHAKVMVCGSSAAGKTNYINLLLGDKFIDKHEPTVVTAAKCTMVKQIIATKNEQNFIEFKKCDPEFQMKILQSHLYHKFYKKDVTTANQGGLEFLSQSEQEEGVTDVVKPKSFQPSQQEEVVTDVVKPKSSQSVTETSTPIEHDESSDDIGVDTFEVSGVLSKMYESDIEEKLATLKLTNVEELSEPWDMLTFLDTGGQPEYVNMLPAISSSVMVTFVVLSLEYGNLGQNVNVFRGMSVGETTEESTEKPTEEPYSYIDLIKMLVSMRKPQMINIPDGSEVLAKRMHSQSYLSFIGTKSDIVDHLDEVVDNIDKELQSRLEEACKPDILTFVNGKHITAISNCNAGEENEDANAKCIRFRLYEKLEETAAIYNIPIAWLLLELQIKCWCKEKARNYIKLEEITGICAEHGLLKKNEETIKMFLKFYHILGVFLYYSKDGHYNNIVITNVQWFFTNLSKLVTFSTTNKNRYDYQKLLKKGLVTKEVFQKMQFDVSNDIDLDYFINIFRLLNIIAVLPLSSDKEQYFVPCILKTCNLESDETSRLLEDRGSDHKVQPLLFQISGTEDCNTKSSENYFYGFARGLFCCLVVDLVKKAKCDFGHMQLVKSTKYLHSNFIIFQYFSIDNNKEYDVVLLDKFIYLEIQIRSECKPKNIVYHQIRDTILDSLKTVVKNLNFSTSCICIAFQCRKCKGESHLTRKTIKNIKSMEPFYCQPNTEGDMYMDTIWFQDYITQVSIKVYNFLCYNLDDNIVFVLPVLSLYC